MAKVTFRRFLTDNEARSSDIIDGQFIVTKDGKSYIDYGTDRVPTNGTLDKQMSDTSLNGVENKVIKKYIDDNINQTKQYSKDYTDNKAKETYSTNEIVVGTWIDGKPIYRKVITSNSITGETVNIPHNIENVKTFIKANIFATNLDRIFYPSYNSPFTIYISKIDPTNIIANISSAFNINWYVYIVLEYTKTTDEVPK